MKKKITDDPYFKPPITGCCCVPVRVKMMPVGTGAGEGIRRGACRDCYQIGERWSPCIEEMYQRYHKILHIRARRIKMLYNYGTKVTLRHGYCIIPGLTPHQLDASNFCNWSR